MEDLRKVILIVDDIELNLSLIQISAPKKAAAPKKEAPAKKAPAKKAPVKKEIKTAVYVQYLSLIHISSGMAVAGLFVIGCFISISMGTSVGTITALAPIAVGISEKTGFSLALCAGAVVGLSLIHIF